VPTRWKEIPAPFTIKDVGARLFESVATSLYEQLEVFREYFQNAGDAYVDFQSLTGRSPQRSIQVRIDKENARLHIFDRGVGMNREDILKAKSIALTSKAGREEDFAGFRGIGIWAGLPACERLEILTSKVYDSHVYKLTINCSEIVAHVREAHTTIDELLQNRYHIYESQEDPDRHYTYVKLIGVHRERYGTLLDRNAMVRYASQHLPVPFDPVWPYTPNVREVLSSIPGIREYNLTIDGKQIYRYYPGPTEVKPPRKELLYDENGARVIGVAWVCETSKRDSTKVIKIDDGRGEADGFSIRVRNFALGDRNAYANSEVIDRDNLSWYTGEVYITDPAIQPDTNRRKFEESIEAAAAIRALRTFYTRVATGSRGWSEQVVVEKSCTTVADVALAIQSILDDSLLSLGERKARVNPLLASLEKHQARIESAKRTATAVSTGKESARVDAERRYLRGIVDTIDTALGTIQAISDRVSRELGTIDSVTLNTDSKAAKPKSKSKARTNRLGGEPITTENVLNTEAIAGPLPSREGTSNNGAVAPQLVELSLAIEAFLAALRAVVPEDSDIYREVTRRLPDELRRRGVVNV
jgi:histidine kinase/DNA gyrase B/HSP90-like ATPase